MAPAVTMASGAPNDRQFKAKYGLAGRISSGSVKAMQVSMISLHHGSCAGSPSVLPSLFSQSCSVLLFRHSCRPILARASSSQGGATSPLSPRGINAAHVAGPRMPSVTRLRAR